MGCLTGCLTGVCFTVVCCLSVMGCLTDVCFTVVIWDVTIGCDFSTTGTVTVGCGTIGCGAVSIGCGTCFVVLSEFSSGFIVKFFISVSTDINF